jgi:fructose-1,6-bisphosphatase
MSSQYAKQSPLTLTHFILSTTRRKFPEATGEFAILMNAIESATKFISSKVRAAGFVNFSLVLFSQFNIFEFD